MKLNDKVVLLVRPNINRTHLIIQNLTDADVFLLSRESVEKSDYTNNGMCLKVNGIFEDYGVYKGGLYGYAATECDVRVCEL